MTRQLALALCTLALAACVSHPPAVSEKTPPLNPDLAAKATAIIVVKDAQDEGGSKWHAWTAKAIRTLRAPPGVTIPADLHFAQYGWDPDIPAGTVVLYGTYFEDPPQNLRSIGWSPLK